MNNVDILADMLKLVNKNIAALEKVELSCCGVTVSQCHTILEIGKTKEISLIDLADILSLDKSTMSRTINNLVEQGIAHRVIDSENRRYVKITLTDKGQAVYVKINSVINEYCEKIVNAIPEKNRKEVVNSIELLIKALKENNCC